MKIAFGAFCLAALVLPGASSRPPALAQGASARAARSGAWISVRGTIVAIDPRTRTIVLRHGALDTSVAGDVRCRFRDPRLFGRARVGARLIATADTAHHPWSLEDVRVAK